VQSNSHATDGSPYFGASLTNVVTVCWIRAIHPQHCSLLKILFHDWLIIQAGYAVSMRERDLDTGGIAAPVFNGQSVIGSLAVIGPVNRMKRNGIQRIGRQVKTVANELSRELAAGEIRRIAR
jgi:Bacterial transcriptional regulator